MFKHYLTTALRHFRQHKLTTSINVVCLTIGLVCFLTLYTMIAYLSSGDRHYPKANRTYLISQGLRSSMSSTFSAWVTAKYLKADFPEIETVARATFNSGVGTEVPITAGERKGFAFAAYADPEFLDVFALPFLAGDSKYALRAPRSAVLSDATAVRLFGSAAAAIGHNVRLQDGTELTVRGVVGKLKKPSHIRTSGDEPTPDVRFDVLISMDVFESAQRQQMTWSSFPYVFTYVVLPKDGSLSVESLRERLRSFAERHAKSDGNTYEFGLVRVSDYWLSGMGSMTGTDKSGPITMFYFLGAIVLLISCLNYANLATAQATTRAKEIGMRRTMGARRGQIMTQFMMESALLSTIALLCAQALIAIGIFVLQLPGAAFVMELIVTDPGFWILLVALLVTVTLAAGMYPSFVLSAVRPIHAVRAGNTRNGGRLVARSLVALQFVGASFLLISLFVMNSQNRMLKHAVLDNSADAMVAVSNDIRAANVDFDVLRTELMRQPHIRGMTASLMSPWSMITITSPIARSPQKDAPGAKAAQVSVNYDFFATMGIKLLAGRAFDREHAGDDLSSSTSTDALIPNVVIDRFLAEQNGWARPGDALGKTLYVADRNKTPLPRTVVGVVENRPMSVVSPDGGKANMYMLAREAASFPLIRIDSKDHGAALKEIESVWERLAPSIALKTRFADEIVNRNIEAFGTVTTVFAYVAALALVISILGLIGMSFHVIGRRQREIGVRKTLGASVSTIVQLLLTDFSKPVIVANFIAWPLGYSAMQLYLSMFTQRTSLSPTPFIGGLAVTVLIAWIAVAAQATRAARMNPATVLRNE